MKVSSAIRRAYGRFFFRLARRQPLEGVDVRALFVESDQRPAIDAKITEAFALLRTFGPRHLERLRTHTDGVLLNELAGYKGAWLRHPRLICLSQKFIFDSATKPVHVAATLVHEVTHAWLDVLGFSYRPQYRARIEAICYRAEAAFAHRVPGCDDVASEYAMIADTIAEGVDIWTDEDIRARARSGLEEVGVPAWLARVLSRLPTVVSGD